MKTNIKASFTPSVVSILVQSLQKEIGLLRQAKRIIAIDGHSACGKSTLAKDLARLLDYNHLDSGAMYRAVD